jgi:hypothetical protein
VKRRFFQTILPALILTGIALYLGDYLSLRYRIPKREQYGSVTVRQLYAVKLKNKQTEYMFQPPAPQECVNSLFPQFGDPPCWYLSRHTKQQISVDSGAPHFWDR